MKIGIFTNNYLPNPYGVTQSIESFRKQFEKRGHSVFIFAPFCRGYKDENPNVFRYPSVNLKYKISFPLAIPYSRKISRIIEKLDLDIIHSQHPTLLGKTAMKWSCRKNIPLIFTWHTLYDQYVHFAPLVPKKWAARWAINNAVKYANSANYVVTPTKSVKEIIERQGVFNKNISAIPSGVDEENFAYPDRISIRKKYGIKDNETLLFSVCRLTAEKNVEFLFRSAIKVLEKRANAKFLVVSDGDLKDKLKKMGQDCDVGGKIIFAGIISRGKIKNYFAAGDIFVYASKSETQGMVVSEAMYMGLPVVAVNATGSRDLIENNINGFLVPENENRFAEAVSKLLANAELRKKFSENSKRIAREKYTDKVCAEKMLEIYAAALNHKKRPHAFSSGR